MRNKGNIYFDLLRELAGLTLEGASLMRSGVEMKKTSAKAAKAGEEILQKLSEEFLPPLEREDIAALTFSLIRLLGRCAQISAYSGYYDSGQKLVLNVYYYIKIIYDAVGCLGEAARRDNVKKCIEQMNSLGAKCGEALIEERQRLISDAGAKKPLAGIVLCDVCGGCYDDLNGFCELLETVLIKNS